MRLHCRLLKPAAALALGAIAARLCVALHTPLPWLIGPLLATAAANVSGAGLRLPGGFRNAGQWVIGMALGLYFTPAVLQQVWTLAPWIVLAVLFSLMLGAVAGRVLSRLGKVDAPTAFFAMAIGGATEMAIQAERVGARVDRVAAAHSLRVILVVVILPFTFKYSGVHGADPYVAAAQVVNYRGLAMLAAATVAAALLFSRKALPNGWMIAPLLVATALTAAGLQLSALPQWLINAGQLFIGCALGSKFSPQFFRAAPRYMAAAGLVSLSLIGCCALFGVMLAKLSGIAVPTAILATAPGGIAEMSLTARLLQLGVPVVTAFHVLRMAAVVLSIGPAYRLLRPWLEASSRSSPPVVR